MEDILKLGAVAFKNILGYKYSFEAGKKKKLLLTVVGCRECEYVHIFGLEHLRDVPIVTANTKSAKEAIYRQIVNGNITFDDISSSNYLYSPIVNSQQNNSIYERLLLLTCLDEILNSTLIIENKAKIYKWDLKKSQIWNNGKKRVVNINADYLLKVNFRDKTVYIFLKNKEIPKDKNLPIETIIISAFADDANLTQGQELPYTILKSQKINISTNNVDFEDIREGYKSDNI